MRYPANLAPQKEGGYTVTFPDIPEAITQGEDVEDALQHGYDVLLSAIDYYFEEKLPVPLPSRIRRGKPSVALPASVSAKILLHNEMLAKGVRRSELARRMHLPQPRINRLLNLRHASRMDTIEDAFRVLGKTLEVAAV